MQIAQLQDYQFVRVSGPDAIQFLQGQLTCDMESLSSTHSLSGALCNLKGRVIANFHIAKHGDDCLLRTTTAMADVIIATLTKYAVFSKVELLKDEKVQGVFGFIDSEAENLLKARFADTPAEANACSVDSTAIILRSPGALNRYEVWCLDHVLWEEFNSLANTDSAAEQWRREEVKAGIAHVDQDSSEEYTPQLLNYDVSGVVDFNKGCYTGQEVVARMYYRGKPKKRLYLLSSESKVEIEDELLQIEAEKSKNAELIAISNSASASGTDNYLLAILDTAAVENNASFKIAKQSESFLQIQTLPYTE